MSQDLSRRPCKTPERGEPSCKSCDTSCYFFRKDNGPLGFRFLPGSGVLTALDVCINPTDGTCFTNDTNPCPTTPSYCPRISRGSVTITDCCDLNGLEKINFINGDLIILSTGSCTPSNPNIPTPTLVLRDILPNLLGVNGSIWIVGTAYVEITGFKKLRWVTGSIYIYDNTVLTTIPTFPSLVSVSASIGATMGLITTPPTDQPCLCCPPAEGCPQYVKGARIVIAANPLLRTISGFDEVRQITNGIFIYDNACLISIIGFNHLYQTEEIYIDTNAVLCAICGFSRLEEIQYLLLLRNNLSGNNNLKIDAFDNLIVAQLVIAMNLKNLKKLTFPKLVATILAYICGNYQLECLRFPRLAQIEDLAITNNDKLTFLEFDELDTVGGSLVIAENHDLEKLDTFGKLRRVGKVIKIVNNHSLLSILNFQCLRFVGQTSNICDVYEGLNCIPINPITFFIRTGACPAADPPAVAPPQWTNYGLDDTNYSANIEDLSVIDLSLPDSFYTLICNSDVTCTDLAPPASVVTSISYSIVITGNHRLRLIEAFNNVRDLDSSLWIVNNRNLCEIRAFAALQFVIDIGIRNNPDLKRIYGFQSLINARDIAILETACLETICSFKSLEFVQTLRVETKTPDGLVVTTPLPSVVAIDYYYDFGTDKKDCKDKKKDCDCDKRR